MLRKRGYGNLFFSGLAILSLSACGGEDNSASPQPASTQPAPIASPAPDPLAWQEVSPEEVGLSSEKLEEAASLALRDGTYGQAFVVVKNGKIAFERYRGISQQEADFAAPRIADLSAADLVNSYGVRDKDSSATSWSMAKSFTSILFGIGIDRGIVRSTQDTVGLYLNELATDARSSITLRAVLDMRSGLVPMCSDPANREARECGSEYANGGNIIWVDDQMTPCLTRGLAQSGAQYPWWQNGTAPYPAGAWVYSNCDTMILGEVLSRGQGDHLSEWAERHLFSPIGMDAEWWRDNSQARGGNVLSYCCIDATPRDFARLGQLVLNRGSYGGRQVISQSYIDSIIEAASQQQAFYFAQFWFADTQSGQRFIVALGFDGQMMAVDVEHQIVVVRSSLYQPILNATGERSMLLKPNETQQSNWVGSLPQGMGVSYYAEYDFRKFLDLVSEAVVN